MQVVITPEAEKQYQRLSQKEQVKIIKKLSSLEKDPFAGKKLLGNLSELRSLRAWPYRVIYYLNLKNKKIYITSILHRQGAYK